MNLLITSILLSIVALIVNLDYFIGSSMLARPVVAGTLVGFVMGDLQTGIMTGAAIELAFIGSFSIGAAIPPDMVSGTILGTAFAISMHAGAEVALPLALPIATLVLIVKNLVHVVIMPAFATAADRSAEKGNYKTIMVISIVAGFVYILISQMIPVGLGFYFGADVIQSILNSIPKFVMDGLSIATGVLPAFGLALLLKPLLDKKSIIFFLLGFVLVVYLKLPLMAVAFLGLFIALVLTGYVHPEGLMMQSSSGQRGEEIDYESEGFE